MCGFILEQVDFIWFIPVVIINQMSKAVSDQIHFEIYVRNNHLHCCSFWSLISVLFLPVLIWFWFDLLYHIYLWHPQLKVISNVIVKVPNFCLHPGVVCITGIVQVSFVQQGGRKALRVRFCPQTGSWTGVGTRNTRVTGQYMRKWLLWTCQGKRGFSYILCGKLGKELK